MPAPPAPGQKGLTQFCCCCVPIPIIALLLAVLAGVGAWLLWLH